VTLYRTVESTVIGNHRQSIDTTDDILNRYIMLGRDICEKYQSRDEKFPESNGEGNLVSRLVFFANTPPNMIYLFYYTEYYIYLEHLLNK
jgi:hypothetical protein